LLGVQCILMGLLAELLMRTYHESQHKPTYSAAELINFEKGREVVRPKLLTLLVCPGCGESFHLEATVKEGEEVVEGTLACPGCEARYPIVGGIPRILPAAMVDEQRRTSLRSGGNGTGFTASRLEPLHEQFLDWIAPLSADDVRGRIVLDGGLRHGTVLGGVQPFGSKGSVGVDISLAVEAAWQNTRCLPNVHVVQADICHLPFRQGSGDFDFIFSIGVLHHLPDPQAGFCALAPSPQTRRHHGGLGVRVREQRMACSLRKSHPTLDHVASAASRRVRFRSGWPCRCTCFETSLCALLKLCAPWRF